MKPGDLSPLLRLRRQRERKAMNLLAMRRHQLQHAEAELSAASEAADEHERQSREAERRRLADLVGQELRAGQLAMLQSGLNADADRQRTLLGHVRKAEKTRQERQGEVDSARAEFRKRHRQAEKLLLLKSRLDAKAKRRGTAIAEAAVDEIIAGRAAGAPSVFFGDE